MAFFGVQRIASEVVAMKNTFLTRSSTSQCPANPSGNTKLSPVAKWCVLPSVSTTRQLPSTMWQNSTFGAERACRSLPHAAAQLTVLRCKAFQRLIGGAAADGAAGLAGFGVGEITRFNTNELGNG